MPNWIGISIGYWLERAADQAMCAVLRNRKFPKR